MGIIDRLEDFSNTAFRYMDEHSKWVYGIGSVIIYLAIVIPVTITSGFHLLFTVSMLLAACIIGWGMMLVYILPFALIQLFCYCVRNPKDAFLTAVKIIFSFIALTLFAFWLRATLYGEYDD